MKVPDGPNRQLWPQYGAGPLPSASQRAAGQLAAPTIPHSTHPPHPLWMSGRTQPSLGSSTAQLPRLGASYQHNPVSNYTPTPPHSQNTSLVWRGSSDSLYPHHSSWSPGCVQPSLAMTHGVDSFSGSSAQLPLGPHPQHMSSMLAGLPVHLTRALPGLIQQAAHMVCQQGRAPDVCNQAAMSPLMQVDPAAAHMICQPGRASGLCNQGASPMGQSLSGMSMPTAQPNAMLNMLQQRGQRGSIPMGESSNIVAASQGPVCQGSSSMGNPLGSHPHASMQDVGSGISGHSATHTAYQSASNAMLRMLQQQASAPLTGVHQSSLTVMTTSQDLHVSMQMQPTPSQPSCSSCSGVEPQLQQASAAPHNPGPLNAPAAGNPSSSHAPSLSMLQLPQQSMSAAAFALPITRGATQSCDPTARSRQVLQHADANAVGTSDPSHARGSRPSVGEPLITGLGRAAAGSADHPMGGHQVGGHEVIDQQVGTQCDHRVGGHQVIDQQVGAHFGHPSAPHLPLHYSSHPMSTTSHGLAAAVEIPPRRMNQSGMRASLPWDHHVFGSSSTSSTRSSLEGSNTGLAASGAPGVTSGSIASANAAAGFRPASCANAAGSTGQSMTLAGSSKFTVSSGDAQSLGKTPTLSGSGLQGTQRLTNALRTPEVAGCVLQLLQPELKRLTVSSC